MCFSTMRLFMLICGQLSRKQWSENSWHLFFACFVLASAYSELHGSILLLSSFYRFGRWSKLYKVTQLIRDGTILELRQSDSRILTFHCYIVSSGSHWLSDKVDRLWISQSQIMNILICFRFSLNEGWLYS